MDRSNPCGAFSSLLCLCVGLVAGCSSPDSPDRGSSAVNRRDASSDGSREAGSGGSGGAAQDASENEAGLECLERASDACARMPSICHWDVTTFCGRERRPSGMLVCDEYRVVVYRDPDITSRDYYDGTTGDLVAMIAHYHVGDTVRCNVGPPHFIQPGRCTNGTNFYCSDAGADAGGGIEAGRD